MTSLIGTLSIIVAMTTLLAGLGVTSQQQLVYGWPAGTTESQKEKILTATSELDLSVEEVRIGEDRMYESSDAWEPGSKEYQDLMDCGFVDKYGFEILQCLEDKGYTIR